MKPSLRAKWQAAWARAQAVEPFSRRLRRWMDYLLMVMAMVWCWDALSSRFEHEHLWEAIHQNAQVNAQLIQQVNALTAQARQERAPLPVPAPSSSTVPTPRSHAASTMEARHP